MAHAAVLGKGGGSEAVLGWLLAQPGLPLEAPSANGFTPLHLAVFKASGPLVAKLLTAGADPNNLVTSPFNHERSMKKDCVTG